MGSEMCIRDRVWIDCEMTGLSLTDDALVEVAALVTDSELNVLGEGVDICLLYTSDAADDMQCVDLGCRRIIKKKKKKNEFFFFKQKTAYFFFSSRRRHTR